MRKLNKSYINSKITLRGNQLENQHRNFYKVLSHLLIWAMRIQGVVKEGIFFPFSQKRASDTKI